MLIGHFAVAFAAKKFAPQTSLGTLFIAVLWADLLWPVFLLLGIEHARIEPGNTVVTPLDFISYPYSHSLVSLGIIALVWAVVYYGISNYPRGVLMLALGIISHWILDVITHRPDMPLGFVGVKVGMGLWNSLDGTIFVEAAMFIVGVFLYLRTTKSRDWKGIVGLWTLLAVLAGIYYANLFGPPPPSMEAIAIAGNAGWLFVLWAFWIDRHRQFRPLKKGLGSKLPKV